MDKSLKLTLSCIASFLGINSLAILLNIYLQFQKAKTLFPSNFTMSFSSKGIHINDKVLGLFEGDYFLLISIFASIFLILVFYRLCIKFYGSDEPLALHMPIHLKVVIPLSIGSLIALYLLENLMYKYLPGKYFDTNLVIATSSNVPLLMLQVILLSPLIEELLFRGVLFHYLINRFSHIIAILLSSLVFTIVHTQYGKTELTILFLSALTSGYLRYISKSFYPSFIVHVCNNCIPFLLYFFKH